MVLLLIKFFSEKYYTVTDKVFLLSRDKCLILETLRLNDIMKVMLLTTTEYFEISFKFLPIRSSQSSLITMLTKCGFRTACNKCSNIIASNEIPVHLPPALKFHCMCVRSKVVRWIQHEMEEKKEKLRRRRLRNIVESFRLATPFRMCRESNRFRKTTDRLKFVPPPISRDSSSSRNMDEAIITLAKC